MLKPPRDQPEADRPTDERSVGDLVNQLVDDGKAYARAEIEVVKALARAKAGAYKWAGILLGAALAFGLAAIVGLAAGVTMALMPLVGPLLAGIIAAILFGGLAGALAMVALKKIREAP